MRERIGLMMSLIAKYCLEMVIMWWGDAMVVAIACLITRVMLAGITRLKEKRIYESETLYEVQMV